MAVMLRFLGRTTAQAATVSQPLASFATTPRHLRPGLATPRTPSTPGVTSRPLGFSFDDPGVRSWSMGCGFGDDGMGSRALGLVEEHDPFDVLPSSPQHSRNLGTASLRITSFQPFDLDQGGCSALVTHPKVFEGSPQLPNHGSSHRLLATESSAERRRLASILRQQAPPTGPVVELAHPALLGKKIRDDRPLPNGRIEAQDQFAVARAARAAFLERQQRIADRSSVFLEEAGCSEFDVQPKVSEASPQLPSRVAELALSSDGLPLVSASMTSPRMPSAVTSNDVDGFPTYSVRDAPRLRPLAEPYLAKCLPALMLPEAALHDWSPPLPSPHGRDDRECNFPSLLGRSDATPVSQHLSMMESSFERARLTSLSRQQALTVGPKAEHEHPVLLGKKTNDGLPLVEGDIEVQDEFAVAHAARAAFLERQQRIAGRNV